MPEKFIPAKQDIEDDFWLSGKWRTVYIASTIPDKTAENGPFRAYLCYLVFDDEQGTVDFYFYVKLNGEWVAKHVMGKKTKNNTYVVEYEGENKFEVIYASDTVLVVSVVNKDKNKKCGEIQLAAIFVKVNDIEEKALEMFKELLKLKGIEEKYIVNFFESDNQNLMKKEKPKSEASDFPAERSCKKNPDKPNFAGFCFLGRIIRFD
ncbi:hypothetical protein E5288_WYG012046 [Bos mutus]|uniref:Lipocalin/cytosolic fatty-acid binding domain-containing protein n=1 Tax=Bos mutus TaxID=72004 RepID=A0A6B0R8D3_9CETA|nr:hypothetical protein [Bos mutus]